MRELNLQYRGIDKPTDVLSFPQIDQFRGVEFCNQPISLGDIIIDLHQAKRQAEDYGSGFYEELKRLLIHGLLHLLGYDHEKNRYQALKMRRMENELLKNII